MSVHPPSNAMPRWTIRRLQKLKGKRPIVMLTAYDHPTASLLDEAGVDCLLVGDSLGMVVQGHRDTLGVTVRDMIYHGEMVARGSHRALVVVDLPFPVGQISVEDTLRQSARIMKRTGCQSVKLEGGADQAETIRRLVAAGIPVVAHVGLRPQTVHALGGYLVQRNADQILADALAAEQAGAWAVLMECVPQSIAERVTEQLRVPTIGIGAGVHCDGQVLVTHDLLGWHASAPPKFVRQLCDLRSGALEAAKQFCEQVHSRQFPGESETFS